MAVLTAPQTLQARRGGGPPPASRPPGRNRPGSTRWRRRALLAWAWTAVFLDCPLGAGAEASTEHRVKAAYLFNFAKFIEWPARAFSDPQAPLVFAVLGQDPFGEVLDQTLKGKTIGGRELTVKRFKTTADLEPCHILFVSDSEKDRWPELLQALKGRSTATVADREGFTRAGGTFRFFLEDNKVRFEINIDAAERAELKVSSKLLKVAVIVHDPPREGK